MKVKITAAVLLILTVSAVWINTVVLGCIISEQVETVSAFEIGEDGDHEAAISLYDGFREIETFMSLTVNHNDLTDIEGLFAEMIGCLSVGDREGATITKSRLIDALKHLKRLSGANIDSII